MKQNIIKAMEFAMSQTAQQPQSAAVQQVAANTNLYSELEKRYGGGFAQWMVDRIEQQKQ
jgi:hypothetical protein